MVRLVKKSLSILLVVLFGVVASAISLSIFFDESSQEDPTALLDEMTIGLILPLTGDLSTHGEESKVAAKLAVSNFNKYLQEVDKPWRLKVMLEDTATNPVTSLDKLTSLHAQGVDLVVGPQSSAELRLMKGYADSNGMILISPSSTSPSLAISDDNIFRLIPDDTKQGPALAKLVEHSSVKVLVPVWRADTWGDGLHDAITDSFVKRGGIVDDGIRYNPESPEFSASTSLLAEKVQKYVDEYGEDNVGVIIISFAEILQFIQSASNHDVLDDVRWFGSDGNTKEERLIADPIGLKFANDVSFTTTQVATNENEIHKAVSDYVLEDLGRTPNSYAYSSYDAVYVAGLSILQSQNTGNTIKDTIPNVAANYSGAIGSAKLNEAGDLDQADYDIWGIMGEEWILLGKYTQSDDSITLG